MACKIAENTPLKSLQTYLGLPSRCHSFRKKCISNLQMPDGTGVLAIQGAVLGYCQALFSNQSDSANLHTQSVVDHLQKIEAPWHRSHELFLGYKPSNMRVNDYVRSASKPLAGSGRVPILITGLCVTDPLVEEIVQGDFGFSDSETMLVRLILENEHIDQAVFLMEKLIAAAECKGSMPQIWPLFQSNLSLANLMRFRAKLGSNWKFTNFAVSPFNGLSLIDSCPENVTVAQWVVGSLENIHADGKIVLSDEVRVYGAENSAGYQVQEFSASITELPYAPTNILLGPSQPSWNADYNSKRISKYLGIAQQAIQSAWKVESQKLRKGIWSMPA